MRQVTGHAFSPKESTQWCAQWRTDAQGGGEQLAMAHGFSEIPSKKEEFGPLVFWPRPLSLLLALRWFFLVATAFLLVRTPLRSMRGMAFLPVAKGYSGCLCLHGTVVSILVRTVQSQFSVYRYLSCRPRERPGTLAEQSENWMKDSVAENGTISDIKLIPRCHFQFMSSRLGSESQGTDLVVWIILSPVVDGEHCVIHWLAGNKNLKNYLPYSISWINRPIMSTFVWTEDNIWLTKSPLVIFLATAAS